MGTAAPRRRCNHRRHGGVGRHSGTQFTCFTRSLLAFASTNATNATNAASTGGMEVLDGIQALSLLALLVQKYKY